MVQEIARRAQESGRLAIDTEFMSERRYQAMLCLVQVAVPDPGAPDGVRTEVIDPLASDAPDPAPLAAALADPEVQVIVHAGRQDVAILRRTWSTDVVNLFDTQVAAGFVGLGTQESYKTLVRRVLRVELPAGEAYTNWDRRPLTDEQVRYARADAAHLLALGGELEERLIEAGREAWAREESRALEAASDERDLDTAYRKLPKVDRLRGPARAVARELVEWRDAAAREADRSVGSVVPDHVLVELTRRRPASRGQLAEIRGLPEATLHRRHRDLLAAIERGAAQDPPPTADAAPAPDPRGASATALASALVRHRSQETGVAVQLIATQPELTRLVDDVRHGRDSEARVLTGWRRELVGAELLDLLSGRLSLAVDEHGGLAVRPA
ncbi:MAG TPA: HRDC domain-containing protein [Solirubrobacteraceae bacterium]|nr:HRDC domain-containing protein [Solirubrobacteraceae bacterium]